MILVCKFFGVFGAAFVSTLALRRFVPEHSPLDYLVFFCAAFCVLLMVENVGPR